MKALNKITTGAMAVMCILFLDACSKTKNSTPTTSTQSICPATGYYVGPNGQNIPCQVGATINTAYTNPYGWQGGQTYPNGVSNCYQYTQYYGVQYIPVNLQGSIMCVRYDIVAQYSGGTSYANYGYDYYYAYPIEASYQNYGGGGVYDQGSNLWFSFNFSF